MRLLIFGGGGQVASELVEHCARHDVDAIAVGRGQCDIRDANALMAALAGSTPTVVVNTAAYTAVDRAESEPTLAFSVNRDGAMNLAVACKAHGVPLIHMSTDYVFDGAKPEPYVEADETSPINVYGSSKRDGEEAVRKGTDQHVILRTAWVYGAHGRNFLKTMLELARTRPEWNVVHDQVGNPTSTADIAAALVAAARASTGGHVPWGTYHFTGSGDATWYEFANEIVRVQGALTGRTPVLRPISTDEYPTAARRPRNSRLRSDLFAEAFGVRAVPWQSRVRDAVSALVGQ